MPAPRLVNVTGQGWQCEAPGLSPRRPCNEPAVVWYYQNRRPAGESCSYFCVLHRPDRREEDRPAFTWCEGERFFCEVVIGSTMSGRHGDGMCHAPAVVRSYTGHMPDFFCENHLPPEYLAANAPMGIVSLGKPDFRNLAVNTKQSRKVAAKTLLALFKRHRGVLIVRAERYHLSAPTSRDEFGLRVEYFKPRANGRRGDYEAETDVTGPIAQSLGLPVAQDPHRRQVIVVGWRNGKYPDMTVFRHVLTKRFPMLEIRS